MQQQEGGIAISRLPVPGTLAFCGVVHDGRHVERWGRGAMEVEVMRLDGPGEALSAIYQTKCRRDEG